MAGRFYKYVLKTRTAQRFVTCRAARKPGGHDTIAGACTDTPKVANCVCGSATGVDCDPLHCPQAHCEDVECLSRVYQQELEKVPPPRVVCARRVDLQVPQSTHVCAACTPCSNCVVCGSKVIARTVPDTMQMDPIL